MLPEGNGKVVQKRTLKKIRPQFLSKKDDAEEEKYVNSDTKYLGGDTICVLDRSLALIETNRKISIGPQNLFLFFKASDFKIEPQLSKKIMRVKFSVGEVKNSLPWDYTLKRLESYGDLELATLAHRLDKFQNLASRIISDLHDSLSNDDPMIRKMWDETKARARKLCEEAEKNHIFYNITFLITKDTQQVFSTSYSEGLLEEMGFAPESFPKWTEKNGMPSLFPNDSPVWATGIRNFLEFTVFTRDKIYVSPVQETFLYDHKKAKKKVLVQNLAALEPVSNGFLLHSYFLVQDIQSKTLEVKKKCEEV